MCRRAERRTRCREEEFEETIYGRNALLETHLRPILRRSTRRMGTRKMQVAAGRIRHTKRDPSTRSAILAGSRKTLAQDDNAGQKQKPYRLGSLERINNASC